MPMSNGAPTDDERDGWDIESHPTYPTREEHCPACQGGGSVVVPDREALRDARMARGLTQAALARAADWQPSMVTELETGARPMTQASAERYWRALHEAEKRP